MLSTFSHGWRLKSIGGVAEMITEKLKDEESFVRVCRFSHRYTKTEEDGRTGLKMVVGDIVALE